MPKMSTAHRCFAAVAALAPMIAMGCAASPEPDSEDLVGEPELDTRGDGVTGSVAPGTTLIATTDVNLRAGPSTSKKVLHVVADGSKVVVVSADPQNGFYHVDHHGIVGWTYGKYYQLGDPPADPGGQGGDDGEGGSGEDVEPEPSSPRVAAIARAKASKGFSYWWGHGRFHPDGPTQSTKGWCSGSCPSCSHGGEYGGDCSGLVAKVWQVPASNSDLTVDSHPYGTIHFNKDSNLWSTIPRAKLKEADAMVYNSNGSGHIFVYASGDPWGSVYSYECKGCSYGCVAGYRKVSSAYHAIRRAGW